MLKSTPRVVFVVSVLIVLATMLMLVFPSKAGAADLQRMPDEYKLYSVPPAIDRGGFRVEVAFGYNITRYLPHLSQTDSDGGFFGPNDTARLVLRYNFDRAWRPSRCTAIQPFMSYTHISHLSAGEPFNDDQREDVVNTIELGWTMFMGCGR